MILETDALNAPVASYVLGGAQILSQTKNGITSHLLPDAQGSTRLLTNTSGAAIVTQAFEYTAFGDLLSVTTPDTRYLYTGQQYDSATDLYSLRARYYDAGVGRFVSRDTWAYDFANPVELNRYVYVANNPVKHYDPTGNEMVMLALKQHHVDIPSIPMVGKMGAMVTQAIATQEFMLFMLAAAVATAGAVAIPVPGIPGGVGVDEDKCGNKDTCQSYAQQLLDNLLKTLTIANGELIRRLIRFAVWVDGGFEPAPFAFPNNTVGQDLYRQYVSQWGIWYDSIPDPIATPGPRIGSRQGTNMIIQRWNTAIHVYISFRFGGTNVVFDNRNYLGLWGVFGHDEVRGFQSKLRRVQWRDCKKYQGLNAANARDAAQSLMSMVMGVQVTELRTGQNRLSQPLWHDDDCRM